MEFTGAANLERLQNYHRNCVESQLKGINARDENWTKSIAVGSESFVEEICSLLGHKVKSRNLVEERDKFILKEQDVSYNVVFGPKMDALRAGNSYFGDSN